LLHERKELYHNILKKQTEKKSGFAWGNDPAKKATKAVLWKKLYKVFQERNM